MKLKIGAPVSGKNFFPRPDIIFRLRKALGRDHVSFLAPRRTGKTSVLIHLEESSAEDHPRFRINLETCTTPAEMVTALLKAVGKEGSRWSQVTTGIWKKVSASMEAIEAISIAGTKVTFQKGSKDWQKPADALLHQLLKHDGPITFLLDEFPILVDAIAKSDRDECESMLRWFREWRQRTSDTQIRFLVTGSIGLANVVRRHGFSDTVNDFDSVELPPLQPEDARQFILSLAEGNGLTLSEKHAAQILDLVGNAYPYFLQIFLAEIDNACPPEEGQDRPITSELIRRIYRERIITGPRNKYLPHMWERLEKSMLEEEVVLARAILRAIAKQEKGLSREQLTSAAREALPEEIGLNDDALQQVLEILKHDAYLLQNTDPPYHFSFFSNLLHDYWKRRHA